MDVEDDEEEEETAVATASNDDALEAESDRSPPQKRARPDLDDVGDKKEQEERGGLAFEGDETE